MIRNGPPETTARLLPKNAIRGPALVPPDLDELSRIALESRPDLRAHRMGLSRASAEVALQGAAAARAATDHAAGAVELADYRARLEEAADLTAAHRDAVVRQRRAALHLNTAVGMRIMP